MTLFPSPAHRCLLPSFPFHARWKSPPPFFCFSFCCTPLKRNTVEWLIGDMKVFVAFFFLIESFPAFVRRAEISHLCRLSQTKAFLRVYRKDRKMQPFRPCRPSPQHPGIILEASPPPTRMPFHDPAELCDLSKEKKKCAF